MDGGTLVAVATGYVPTAKVEAMALATAGREAPPAVARPSGGLRVESAAAPERGLFETVLGSLLGFVF
jgi:hypothetical protein